MSLTENLKASGFKPSENTDGQFKPLVGTYECSIITLRPEIDTKNDSARFYQMELKPSIAIEGDAFGDKFTFKKRYYVDGDKGQKNFEKLVNDLFTCGVELDMASDSAFDGDLVKAIGAKAYVRGWSWTPEGKEPQQSFVIQKSSVAEKKKGKATLPF